MQGLVVQPTAFPLSDPRWSTSAQLRARGSRGRRRWGVGVVISRHRRAAEPRRARPCPLRTSTVRGSRFSALVCLLEQYPGTLPATQKFKFPPLATGHSFWRSMGNRLLSSQSFPSLVPGSCQLRPRQGCGALTTASGRATPASPDPVDGRRGGLGRACMCWSPRGRAWTLFTDSGPGGLQGGPAGLWLAPLPLSDSLITGLVVTLPGSC